MVSSLPGARTATLTLPRQRLAQGHPSAADLGWPERLEIPAPSVRWPFGGAEWARFGGFGFEPRPGKKLLPDFADISLLPLFHLCRCIWHLLSPAFLPLNSALVSCVFLSTWSPSSPSLIIWILYLFLSLPCFCVFQLFPSQSVTLFHGLPVSLVLWLCFSLCKFCVSHFQVSALS